MKKRLLTLGTVFVLAATLTGCGKTTEQAVESSITSTSTISSVTSILDTVSSEDEYEDIYIPEPEPVLRPPIKQKIDNLYSKTKEADNAYSAYKKKYGNASNIPASQLGAAQAELERALGLTEEAQALNDELAAMSERGELNDKEERYYESILKKIF